MSSVPTVAAEPAVDERLAEGAPIQWRLSQERCGEACAWYHGTRGYLRALGVQRGIGRDAGFLLEALGSLARQRTFTRVLISAAADCGTFAHLVAAYAAAGAPLRVTMVDRCATPLAINEWYAGQVGVPIETHQANIFEFQTKEPFDLVCTHAFFGQFQPADRQRLVERWHGVLRPGGVVVTANSLRPDKQEPVGRFGVDEVRAIRERASRAAEEARRRFGLAPEMFEAWVEALVQRKWFPGVHSVDHVRDLFEQAGFRLAVLRTAAPLTVGGARRVRMVAERVAADGTR